MNPALKHYQKTMVQTSSPLENIILLNERCLSYLTRLQESIERKCIADKVTYMDKVMDIIITLDSCLDFSQGEIAENLHKCYQCMLAQISQANIKNDVAPLELTKKWLTELLDTWKAIAKIHPG